MIELIVITGIKADHKTLKLLESSQKTEVTHVYNNSLNILIKDKLLTVIGSSWGYIPLGILVNLKKDFSFFSIGIKPDEEVDLSDKMIIIGDKLKIDLRNCEWQRRKVIRKKTERIIVRNNLDKVKHILRGKKTEYGLLSLLDHIDFIFNNMNYIEPSLDPLTGRAVKLLKHFFKILGNDTKEVAIRNLEGIIGLGCGTTPSGDDILLGMITMFNYLDYLRPKDYPLEFENAIRKKTTLVSQKYLIEGTEGNISERLTNYIEALLYSRSEKVLQKEIFNLIKIGASSGKEIILGTVMAGEFYLRAKE